MSGPAPSFPLRETQPDPITRLLSQNRIHDGFSLCLRTRSLSSALKLYSLLSSLPFSVLLFNRLIDLFSKCGSLSHARKLFDEMPTRDLCSYNTLITAYSNAGNLTEARHLFDAMPSKDHFSWSSMISAYSRHHQSLNAIQIYRQCLNESRGYENNAKFVSSAVLVAVASLGFLGYGKEIHCHVVRCGFELDRVMWSALADMYAKCGSIVGARKVFDRMPDRDVVSWTAMIKRCSDVGQRKESLGLFGEMLRCGVVPNDFTFAEVLNVCAELAAEGLGKEIHGHMVRVGFGLSSFAAAAIVDMYSKCGNIEKAWAFLDEIPKPDFLGMLDIIDFWVCLEWTV